MNLFSDSDLEELVTLRKRRRLSIKTRKTDEGEARTVVPTMSIGCCWARHKWLCLATDASPISCQTARDLSETEVSKHAELTEKRRTHRKTSSSTEKLLCRCKYILQLGILRAEIRNHLSRNTWTSCNIVNAMSQDGCGCIQRWSLRRGGFAKEVRLTMYLSYESMN